MHFVTEIFCHRKPCLCNSHTGSRRLVHLSKHERCLFQNTGCLHLTPEVIALTGTLTDTRKDRITALLHRNIPDQLLNQDCFSDARAAKQTDFSALGIRRQKINNLDARLQNLRDRALILKWRRIPVNTPVLLTIQLFSSIYRLT